MQAQRKPALSEQRDDQRELQRRANRVAARVRAIDDLDKLNSARTSLERARGIAQAVADLKTYQARNPVPDKKKLDELKTNRDKILQLQADLNAASMILRVMPIEGAGAAQLALDGEAPRPLANTSPPQAVFGAPQGRTRHPSLGTRRTDSRVERRRPRSN